MSTKHEFVSDNGQWCQAVFHGRPCEAPRDAPRHQKLCRSWGPRIGGEGVPTCVKSEGHSDGQCEPDPSWETSGWPTEFSVPDPGYNHTWSYETKDSGKREEYESGMTRDTQDGKPRFDLLYVDGMPYTEQPLYRWSALLERGAVKYGERNWQLAKTQEELDRFKASAARHFAQWICGETDEDHGAAVFYNIAAAMYVEWRLR